MFGKAQPVEPLLPLLQLAYGVENMLQRVGYLLRALIQEDADTNLVQEHVVGLKNVVQRFGLFDTGHKLNPRALDHFEQYIVLHLADKVDHLRGDKLQP